MTDWPKVSIKTIRNRLDTRSGCRETARQCGQHGHAGQPSTQQAPARRGFPDVLFEESDCGVGSPRASPCACSPKVNTARQGEQRSRVGGCLLAVPSGLASHRRPKGASPPCAAARGLSHAAGRVRPLRGQPGEFVGSMGEGIWARAWVGPGAGAGREVQQVLRASTHCFPHTRLCPALRISPPCPPRSPRLGIVHRSIGHAHQPGGSRATQCHARPGGLRGEGGRLPNAGLEGDPGHLGWDPVSEHRGAIAGPGRQRLKGLLGDQGHRHSLVVPMTGAVITLGAR